MTIGCPKSLIERFNRMVCLIGDQDILQYKNVVPARSSAKTDYSTDGAPDSYVYKIIRSGPDSVFVTAPLKPITYIS